MIKLTGHRTPGDPSNERIVIEADDPDARNGGASHEYLIRVLEDDMRPDKRHAWALRFQRGPFHEPGSESGITNEALIAIVIDRLHGLQSEQPCQENTEALRHFHEGLHWLRERTLNRIAAGTEGRNNPGRVELCGRSGLHGQHLCNHAQSAHTRHDEYARSFTACQLCDCLCFLGRP